MNESDENKWLGRKVALTAMTVLLTAGLAYLTKMTPDVAMVFAAAIGSFNYALRNTN